MRVFQRATLPSPATGTEHEVRDVRTPKVARVVRTDAFRRREDEAPRPDRGARRHRGCGQRQWEPEQQQHVFGPHVFLTQRGLSGEFEGRSVLGTFEGRSVVFRGSSKRSLSDRSLEI